MKTGSLFKTQYVTWNNFGLKKVDKSMTAYQLLADITDEIGIVPFLDGGMVYEDALPQIFGDMRWGAGLGLRYYTPIGPVRLDVATPLNPVDGNPPLQLYISIGQSF